MRDPLRKNENTSVTKSAVAGALSGLVTRTLVSPIDVLKIRLQVTPHAQTRYIVQDLWQMEGLRAFWKGNVPGSIMYVIYGSVQFCSYGIYNRMLSPIDMNDSLHSLLVGGLAGSTGAFVSYPFDTLRTRFVANRSLELFTVYRSMRNMWHHEGIWGFFQGCSTSVLGISLSTAVTFCCYETIRVRTEAERRQHIIYNTLYHGASTISAITAKLITFPLDTLRKRMQLQGSQQLQLQMQLQLQQQGLHPSSTWGGITQLCYHMVHNEGVLSLYRGLSLSLCKTVPTTVLSLWVFQFLMDWKIFQ